MMGRTAEQVYLDLTRVPHAQWAAIISQLPIKVKRELMQLIKQKRELKKQQQQQQVKTISPSSISTTHSSSTPDTTPSLIPIPDALVESQPRKKRKISPANDSAVGSCSSSSSSSEEPPRQPPVPSSASLSCSTTRQRLPGPPNNLDAILSPLTPLRILSVYPLDRICSMMFVAGDADNVLIESEKAVHRYFNFWIAALIQSAIRHFTLQQGNQQQFQEVSDYYEINTESVNQFWNSRKKLAIGLDSFLHSLFSVESEKFNRDSKFQTSARRKLSESVIQTDASSALCSDGDAVCVTTTTATLDNEISKNILPPDRFTERLKARDLRTRSFTQLEYKHFTRNREKSLRAYRPLVVEWIHKAATLVSFPPSLSSTTGSYSSVKETRRHFPQSCVDFILFLVSDRLSSLVECAMRLRAVALQASPDCVPTAVSSLMHNVRDATEIWRKGFIFPSLVSVLESTLHHTSHRISSTSTTPTSTTGSKGASVSASPLHSHPKSHVSPIPLLLEHYRVAIELMIHYVDAPLFQLTEENLKFIETDVPTAPSALLQQQQPLLQQSPSAAIFPAAVPEGANAASSASVRNCHSHQKHDKIHSSRFGLSPPHLPPHALDSVLAPTTHFSTKANQMFNQLVLLATQSLDPPDVPHSTVTFAYLFCRDLFWDKRHEPASVLWEHVKSRYKEWDQDESRRRLVEEKHKQIVSCAEAIHKIIALGKFFDALSNRNQSSSTRSSGAHDDG